MSYLDRFIRLKCAVDLLFMNLFPNAREITETFAMYEAARRRIPGLSPGDKDVTVVVVGDGTTPRTGAFCAFMSAWTCWSIDPNLDEGYYGKNPYRMKLYDGLDRLSAKRIIGCKMAGEEFSWKGLDVIDDKLVVMFPHSHAPVKKISDMIPGPHWIISMPCCFEDGMSISPVTSYDDSKVISAKRTINIYNVS